MRSPMTFHLKHLNEGDQPSRVHLFEGHPSRMKGSTTWEKIACTSRQIQRKLYRQPVILSCHCGSQHDCAPFRVLHSLVPVFPLRRVNTQKKPHPFINLLELTTTPLCCNFDHATFVAKMIPFAQTGSILFFVCMTIVALLFEGNMLWEKAGLLKPCTTWFNKNRQSFANV